MYKLLAIDLDGTLFNSKQQVSQANRSALNKLLAEGIEPVIVTGRGRRGVELSLEMIGMDLAHICSAGAFVRSGIEQEPLLAKTFQNMPELAPVIDYARKKQLAMIADASNGYIWFGPDHLFDDLDPLTARSALGARTMNPEADFDRPLLKLTLVVANPFLAELQTLIKNSCPSLQQTMAGERYLDLTARGVDKGTALSFYAGIINIRPEETAAIGDQLIDIPMFEMAGLSAAMANSPEAVKTAASMVAPSNDQDGVAWFVEKVLRLQK